MLRIFTFFLFAASALGQSKKQGKRCLPPKYFDNGSFRQIDRTMVFECDAGYEFEYPNDQVQQVSIWCGSTGEWSGDYPKCIKAQGGGAGAGVGTGGGGGEGGDGLGMIYRGECFHNKYIPNGWIEGYQSRSMDDDNDNSTNDDEQDRRKRYAFNELSFYTYESIQYFCNEGFFLFDGDSVRTCLPRRKWSGAKPVCAPGCLYITYFQNGWVEESGYDNPRSDDDDDDESDDETNSDDDDDDTDADTRALGNFYIGVGYSVYYYCTDGYELTGSYRRTCQMDGYLSGEMPMCEERCCYRSADNDTEESTEADENDSPNPKSNAIAISFPIDVESNDAGVCSPNPCKGDCRCYQSCQHSGGYYCRSSDGFLGKNCTIPVPSLHCTADAIVVTVSEDFVKEYDLGLRNSYLTVMPQLDRQPSCKVTQLINREYRVRIPLPFSQCGTSSRQASDGTMVFTNQIWFNRALSNTMFDVPLPVIEFQCLYKREYQIVTKIRPVVPTPLTITRTQTIYPTIALCKIPSCPALCPAKFAVNDGALYTVGEMIHVHMHLDSGSYVTGLRTMHLSCDRAPTSFNVVEIVTNGCGTSAGLPCVVSHSATSHSVCVSFQTPRGLSCQEIYIHAELSSCDRSDVLTCQGDRTVKYCPNSRKRRSVAPKSLTIGPIFLLESSDGVGQLRLNGMEDEELHLADTAKNIEALPDASNIEGTGFKLNGLSTSAIVVLSISALLLLASVVALFIYIRSHSDPKL